MNRHESHHPADDELHAFYADRYQRLGLGRYGVTFADYLEEPAGWEAVLGPSGPAKLKVMLAHDEKSAQTPISEALAMANSAVAEVFELKRQLAARTAGEIALANRMREIELAHCIRLLTAVGEFAGAAVLEARLSICRQLWSKGRHAKPVTNPVSTPGKAC